MLIINDKRKQNVIDLGMSKQQEQLNSEWEKFRNLFKREEIPTRTILLKEGEISERMFYIERGCIRLSFNKDGKDITFQFFLKAKVSPLQKVFVTTNQVYFQLKRLNPVLPIY